MHIAYVYYLYYFSQSILWLYFILIYSAALGAFALGTVAGYTSTAIPSLKASENFGETLESDFSWIGSLAPVRIKSLYPHFEISKRNQPYLHLCWNKSDWSICIGTSGWVSRWQIWSEGWNVNNCPVICSRMAPHCFCSEFRNDIDWKIFNR